MLRVHRLHHYCVAPGIPDQYLSEADRLVGNINPAFTTWEVQEQLLFSWLQSSLSASLLPSFIGCRHTWQIWDHIHQNFHYKVKAQACQLRTKLRTLKKGTQIVTKFLDKIKAVSDSLMSIDEIVTTIEQLDVILEGLPSKYESLVTL